MIAVQPRGRPFVASDRLVSPACRVFVEPAADSSSHRSGRLDLVHRAGAGGFGLVLCGFGVLGPVNRLDWFSTRGQPVAGLSRVLGPTAVHPPRTGRACAGSEADVAIDPGLASSRATGGDHEHLRGDRGSVTGTGRTGEFVGRIAGDDLGYAGETGAERRSTATEPGAAAPEPGLQGRSGGPSRA